MENFERSYPDNAPEDADLRLYYERFSHLTRGELSQYREGEAKGLYMRLYRKKLIQYLPDNRIVPDVAAAIKMYREKYDGYSRGELKRIDAYLYDRMQALGCLDAVPLQHRLNREIEDPWEYYLRTYGAECSRTKLQYQDIVLYRLLKESGLLENIKRVRTKVRVCVEWGDDPFGYYLQKYAGKTRGQLVKENKPLYMALHRTGELSKVPRNYKKIDDAVALYKEKYMGLTRSELDRVNHSLYERLRREGKLEQAGVPFAKQDKNPTDPT